jgi:membrane protease YdiL (CAAX protease family)
LIRPLFAPCTLLDLALLSLLAGFGEEVLFRGLIQGALTAWWGPGPALAAASLLFGLCHAVNGAYAVLATVMGGYLGWLFLASENLLVVIVAHALYDFIALICIEKGPARPEPEFVSGEPP